MCVKGMDWKRISKTKVDINMEMKSEISQVMARSQSFLLGDTLIHWLSPMTDDSFPCLEIQINE